MHNNERLNFKIVMQDKSKKYNIMGINKDG